MPTDRSLESLRAEVEELRARFARLQAEDRSRRRVWRRERAARDVAGRPEAPLTPRSSA